MRVFADTQTLAQAAAEHFAARAVNAVQSRGIFKVALSGGGTPLACYRLLAAEYRHLPWAQTHVFWGDERCVPSDHPESSYGQARLALLDHVSLLPQNIHRIRGEWEPMRAAEDTAEQLRQNADAGLAWPRFDLVFLGLGEDGHTASLFHGFISPMEASAPTLAVAGHYQNRPASRVTLTPSVFNSARNVIFLAAGAGKARAVKATLTGPAEAERWPAQRIRPGEGEVIWMLDEDAAAKLG